MNTEQKIRAIVTNVYDKVWEGMYEQQQLDKAVQALLALVAEERINAVQLHSERYFMREGELADKLDKVRNAVKVLFELQQETEEQK